MSFKRGENGVWTQIKIISGDNSYHQRGILMALNGLDPLFRKAYEKNEIGLILTLLRYKTNQEAGWDTLDNLREAYEGFEKIRRKIVSNATHAHFHLFLYGLIIEASEPYEVFANLLNAIEGKPYLKNNFPNVLDPITNRNVPQYPSDKIAQLIARAKKQKIDLSFLNSFFDNKLRNAIFHSDYSIYNSRVRISKPIEKEYSEQEILKIINEAKAYIETFFRLYDNYKQMYNHPTAINIPSGIITTGKGEPITTAYTILRKGKGLIGLGNIPQSREKWRIGTFYPYEIHLIEKGQYLMPESRIKRINKFLNFLPDILSTRLITKLQKLQWLN